MSSAAKKVFAQLAGPGPHEVLRGSLAPVGLAGAVFTPQSGLGRPAIVFGHGWLQPINRYHGLLRHLASWGIVAAAPDTRRGPMASHQRYADDMRTALDACVGVRLGNGEISVDPTRLGLAGHSMGGGCAVLAAADDQRVRAVATVAPAEVHPSAVEAAGRCGMPGLHLAGGHDLTAPAVAHAEAIARAWRGPVTLRTVPKASHLGFTEGAHWSELLLDGRPQRAAQRCARAMLAAFFLVRLADRHEYRPLLQESVPRCVISYRHDETLAGV